MDKSRTTHRLEADKVVIEDDRRQNRPSPHYLLLQPEERRKLPFTYGLENKIIYVLVEPQPKEDFINAGKPHGPTRYGETIISETHWGRCPYSPGDTLILQEIIHQPKDIFIIQKSFMLGRCLGVEEKYFSVSTSHSRGTDLCGEDVITEIRSIKKWCWITLGRENK